MSVFADYCEQHGNREPCDACEVEVLSIRLAEARKLASWYALLLRAVREWDVSWPDRGGVFIGGAHPSKDRTLPCEFDAEGRPIENAELRAAIEGCLDPSPQPTE